MKRISHLAASARNLLLALHLLYAPVALAADPASTMVLPGEEMEKLLATYALIKQNHVGRLNDRQPFEGAISGMRPALDAHSQSGSNKPCPNVGPA